MTTYLITGATGFVGSHVADAAVKRGFAVRALARPAADTTHLKSIGATILPGDVTDRDAVRAAAEGADVVVNCAAKVGDWGPLDEYRAVNVEGLRHLLDAVNDGRRLRRFVHLSSLGVYPARHHYGTDEAEPLPESHVDGYRQSKIEGEKLALEYVRKHNLPVTVIRPGFIYGPRDKTILPRMIERLRRRQVIYIARGQFALNTTNVFNLVDAVFLAIDNPKAVGEVFNVTDGEFVPKRRFIEAVADGMGLPRPRWSVPLWLARPVARWREAVFLRKGKPYPPQITQGVLRFAGYNLDYSIAKARTVLGYEPKVGFDDGMRETLAWFREPANTPG